MKKGPAIATNSSMVQIPIRSGSSNFPGIT